MSDHSITVIGSTNTDMVIKTTRLPLPGQTILGGDFLMNPGGKSANQAVALSEGAGLVEAIAFANKAAAISVTRMGAQASAPYRDEVD